jgi:tetratricopeptide (TPR) repeat protein
LITALLSLRLDSVDNAKAVMGTAGDSDRAKAMRAEILLAEDKTDEALDVALGCYSEDRYTSLALGKCMNAAGRHEEALVYLRMSRRRMMDSGCLFRLDEVIEQEAKADKALGRNERASMLEEAAKATRKDGSDQNRGRTQEWFQRTVLFFRMSISEM